MKVILLEKIRNLGELGSMTQVKAGYARNYLFPKGKALPATKESLAKFETRRAELEKVANESLFVAKQRAEILEGLELIIMSKTTDEGKLFGSVGVREVVDAIALKNISVEKKEVELPFGAIHEIGEHDAHILLHSDVKAKIKLIVEAEK